jgi:hypothetical protein
MLVRSFPNVRELESNELADCGIIEYQRKIYIFSRLEEYQQNTIKHAKAVIVNESVSKGNKEGNMMHIAIDNSVFIRTSVYFCDVIFELPGNVKLSQFRVTSAYSKEVQSLLDQNNVACYLTGNFSEALSKLEYTDENVFNEIINDMETTVLPPTFYNEVQQYKTKQDIYCLGGGIEIYSGVELIDRKTKISFLNINLWDTMRLKFLGVIDTASEGAEKTLTLNTIFHSDFDNFIGENCTFIYDSDGKGPNDPGVNIIGKDIPYKKYYAPKYIPENVRNAYFLFEGTCHDIESAYGHIKVHCAPSKIGNAFKIRFKDYAGTPKSFIPLGNKMPDGDHLSSVDSGYFIEKNIDEVIETIYTDWHDDEMFY